MSIYHDVFTTSTLSNPNTSYSKIISHIKGQNLEVLDVGCASGYLGETITNQTKASVWGIDSNKADIKIAKTKLNHTFRRDLQKTNFSFLPDGKFDYIILADVLEHLTNPQSILQKLAPKLKRSGSFLISLPNFLHYSVKIKILADKWKYTDYGLLDQTHVHFYDLKNFEKLIKSSNLFFDNLDFVISQPKLTDIFQEIIQNKLPLSFRFINQLLSPPSFIFQYIAKVSIKKSASILNYPPRHYSNSTLFFQLQIFKIKNILKNFLKW